MLVYPENLPISSRRSEIIQAIQENPVLVLSGETGSGKTTQIPKMCLEAGRGTKGLIGCTQPRRIAAITVAERIAEELSSMPGSENLVGYKIRFREKLSAQNRIRILTDGMLLAETRSRPRLDMYDTLIIDEAHERSLNIDVLLGMLHGLVKKRRNLKVIITSATLDTQRFSRHFDNAPVIEVSGRTYPVDIRYRSSESEGGELSLPEDTAGEIAGLVSKSSSGDILAFLPTEQDIRDTISIVSSIYSDRLNILPLYSRLPASEQKKVFLSGGKRKLVVATNVAETSLTIPGIRYVVDSGLARLSRYNPGTGTHGLPIEPISRAAASQRAGRCGRVQNGICIRMYTEESYQARPEFTLPEIRRTNLAEVILRLLDLGIQDIENFPFVDPPPGAGIQDGLRTLREIGALEESRRLGKSKRSSRQSRRLSRTGRILASLPLDPRLARMLVEAHREGCLGDVLPLAAVLSIPDPRERPPEKAGSADQAHRRFQDGHSDFMGFLNIWDAFRTSQRKGSYSSRLKHFCRENYMSFRRMKEWMDVHRQLTLVMEEHGYHPRRLRAEPSVNSKGQFSHRYAAIHRAVLSGFLSHIARHEEKGIYEATRGRRLRVHPGSALSGKNHEWIMAAEIVRTSQLYGRIAAAVDPVWFLELGGSLLKRSWIEPRWNMKKGSVLATEQVRLYGFLISADKVIPYASVRPREARLIFIRSALVEEQLADPSSFAFMRENRQLIKEIQSLEDKLRRRDLFAGEDAVDAFYQKNIPQKVVDPGTLNRHIRESGENHLKMKREDLSTGISPNLSQQDFPETAEISGTQWKLSYCFEPGSDKDGVTLQIPSGHLSLLNPQDADWIVPGLLCERIEALMRGLPKAQRRQLIPIPQTARAASEALQGAGGSLAQNLSAWLFRERRVDIPPEDWNTEALPPHLRLRFSLLDEQGKEAASGRSPADLHSQKPEAKLSGAVSQWIKKHRRQGLTDFPDADNALPEFITLKGGIRVWPALTVPEKNGSAAQTVSLDYYRDRAEAELHQAAAQKALARKYWNRELRDLRRTLVLSGQARVNAAYLGGASNIETAVLEDVLSEVFAARIIRRPDEWQALLKEGGAAFQSRARDRLVLAGRVLEAYGNTRQSLNKLAEGSHRKKFVLNCLNDARYMLGADFPQSSNPESWKALPRRLDAVVSRARKGAADPAKDEKARLVWEPLRDTWQQMVSSASGSFVSTEKKQALEEAGQMLQELYVALFAAGEIRPAGKVSESRLRRRLDEIRGML